MPLGRKTTLYKPFDAPSAEGEVFNFAITDEEAEVLQEYHLSLGKRLPNDPSTDEEIENDRRQSFARLRAIDNACGSEVTRQQDGKPSLAEEAWGWTLPQDFAHWLDWR